MLTCSQTPSNIMAALRDIPWASSHLHSAHPQPSLIKRERLVLPIIAWAEIHLSQLKSDFLSFTFLLQQHLHSATTLVGILPQNSSVRTASFSCWGCVGKHAHTPLWTYCFSGDLKPLPGGGEAKAPSFGFIQCGYTQTFSALWVVSDFPLPHAILMENAFQEAWGMERTRTLPKKQEHLRCLV